MDQLVRVHSFGPGNRFTKDISITIQIRRKIFNWKFDKAIVTQLCTRHNNCAAAAWAKQCCNPIGRNWITAKWRFLSNLNCELQIVSEMGSTVDNGAKRRALWRHNLHCSSMVTMKTTVTTAQSTSMKRRRHSETEGRLMGALGFGRVSHIFQMLLA